MLVMPFVVVLAILGVLVIWALPDVCKAPTGLLEVLFFSFFVVLVMWPNYLAIAIPGLPWMTLLRLTAVPLTIVFFVCLSVSSSFRSQLSTCMKSAPWIRNAVFAFAILQVISVIFSDNTNSAIKDIIVAQTNWTVIFAASCYLFTKKGVAEQVAALLCVMAVGLGFLAIWEHSIGVVPWAGHIPSFLQIDDPIVDRVLMGMNRYGHRVQTTYTTCLGLAEYLAVVFPFFLHFVFSNYRIWIRAAAALAIPLVVITIDWTQTRSGFSGLLVSTIVYFFWRYAVQLRLRTNSLLAASVIFLSPALLSVLVAAAAIVPSIRFRLQGGADAAASTQARISQWTMGIDKILHRPWGYGVGQGAESLGFHNPNGHLTIDSYWLRLLLEYGILGFCLFIFLLGACLVYSWRGSINEDPEREAGLFVPAGVSVLTYFFIEAAFAQEDNQSLMFLFTGMLVALTHRYQKWILMPAAGPKRLAGVSPVDGGVVRGA